MFVKLYFVFVTEVSRKPYPLWLGNDHIEMLSKSRSVSLANLKNTAKNLSLVRFLFVVYLL